MKVALPILICSAISAALGYYFGHITIPPGALDGTSSGFSTPANGNSGAVVPPAQAPSQAFAPPAAPAAPAAPATQPAIPAPVASVAPTQPATPDSQVAPTAPATPTAPAAPTTTPVATTVVPTPPAAPATSETASEDTAVFAARAAKTVQTLTDTQGRTISASIVEVTEDNVKIRRTDGLETMIPLSMLSPGDVEFCNYLREQQKEKEASAPPPVKTDGFDWDAYFNS